MTCHRRPSEEPERSCGRDHELCDGHRPPPSLVRPGSDCRHMDCNTPWGYYVETGNPSSPGRLAAGLAGSQVATVYRVAAADTDSYRVCLSAPCPWDVRPCRQAAGLCSLALEAADRSPPRSGEVQDAHRRREAVRVAAGWLHTAAGDADELSHRPSSPDHDPASLCDREPTPRTTPGGSHEHPQAPRST
jgi:hypothetical protein